MAVAGDTAVIGARFDDDEGSNSGSAYIFTRTGSSWSEQAKLTAGDAANGDQFGISVAVSDDTAVIGADLDDDGGSASGSAYMFDLQLIPLGIVDRHIFYNDSAFDTTSDDDTDYQ